MQGCSTIKPVSQWTILQKNKHGGGGGAGFRTYFFESPMEFLGFCFTPKFQTK